MEGAEGLSGPPRADIRSMSVAPPVLEIVKPASLITESIAEGISPAEKGKQSATNAVNFLQERREAGLFEGNAGLSFSVDSVLDHVKDSSDGTSRILDSEGLRDLTSTLSGMEDADASLKLEELKDGMIVRVEGTTDLTYDQWKEETNNPTTTPERREALENAKFGYPKEAPQSGLASPAEGAQEVAGTPAETPNGESQEIPPDEKFLSEVITDLEQKIKEKKASGENFVLEQRLLTFANIAQGIEGKWGPLARASAIRDLNRFGYSSPAELTAQMSLQAEQNKIEVIKLCAEKGMSMDRAQEVWNSISEGGFREFIYTMSSLSSVTEVFGKELKNKDYIKMFGKVLSEDELKPLLEKNDEQSWGAFFLMLYLSMGDEILKVFKGGR